MSIMLHFTIRVPINELNVTRKSLFLTHKHALTNGTTVRDMATLLY